MSTFHSPAIELAVDELIRNDPAGFWEFVSIVLADATEDLRPALAAGPVEDFLIRQPVSLETLGVILSSSPGLQEVVAMTWLDEEDDPELGAMLKNLRTR